MSIIQPNAPGVKQVLPYNGTVNPATGSAARRAHLFSKQMDVHGRLNFADVAFADNTQRLLPVRFFVVHSDYNACPLPGVIGGDPPEGWNLIRRGQSDYVVGDGPEGGIRVDLDFYVDIAPWWLVVDVQNFDTANPHTLDVRADVSLEKGWI